MIDEIKKSVKEILYERVTSPFYGTLATTWLICNWKIVYLTLFVSESKITTTKIDFILNNYSNPHFLFIYPLISATIILTLIPFISNGAYWLHLKFKQWKIDEKNIIERKQLLTLEQSIAIRTELKEKETEFEKLLSGKDSQISLLHQQVSELERRLAEVSSNKKTTSSMAGNSYGSNDYNELKKNIKAFEYFERIAKSIKENGKFPDGLPEKIKEYYLVNDIVQETHYRDVDDSSCSFTNKGNNLYKDFFNDQFSK